jgi:hypothetical protein
VTNFGCTGTGTTTFPATGVPIFPSTGTTCESATVS